MKTVITISRQYGSGGREIGKKLADQLGIPFYDNEIISRAAKDTGFSEAAFESVEDKATNSLLYSIAMGMNVFTSQDTGFAGLSLDDRIFLAQSNVIRKVAEEGACVIVGRCADYVLKDRKDCLNVFIYADKGFRAERIVKQYGESNIEPEKRLADKDKKRKLNYKYFTERDWGRRENYHLSIDSGFLGIEKAVALIVSAAGGVFNE